MFSIAAAVASGSRRSTAWCDATGTGGSLRSITWISAPRLASSVIAAAPIPAPPPPLTTTRLPSYRHTLMSIPLVAVESRLRSAVVAEGRVPLLQRAGEPVLLRVAPRNSAMACACVPSAHSSVPARIPARMPMMSIWWCTTRLFICTSSGATLAMRCATSITASSSSSAGNAWFAQPRSTASTPLIESPVSIISIAVRIPRNHAWKCMSGTPNRTAG